MIPINITGNSIAQLLTNFADDVGWTSGTAIVLSGTTISDGLGHKVVVTNNSATDYSSGKTFALVGTNANGEPQTETLAGPAASVTSTSTKYFKTLTSITPNFARTAADTFDIGVTAASVSAWAYLNTLGQFAAPGMGFATIVDSGSPTYSVQFTFDGGVTAHNHATVAAQTTTQTGTILTPVQAVRLIWSAAGGVTLHGLF